MAVAPAVMATGLLLIFSTSEVIFGSFKTVSGKCCASGSLTCSPSVRRRVCVLRLGSLKRAAATRYVRPRARYAVSAPKSASMRIKPATEIRMAPMTTKTTDSAEVKTDFFDRALAPLTRRGASDAASLKARMIYRRKITPPFTLILDFTEFVKDARSSAQGIIIMVG